jgi:hypothetical protein
MVPPANRLTSLPLASVSVSTSRAVRFPPLATVIEPLWAITRSSTTSVALESRIWPLAASAVSRSTEVQSVMPPVDCRSSRRARICEVKLAVTDCAWKSTASAESVPFCSVNAPVVLTVIVSARLVPVSPPTKPVRVTPPANST